LERHLAAVTRLDDRLGVPQLAHIARHGSGVGPAADPAPVVRHPHVRASDRRKNMPIPPPMTAGVMEKGSSVEGLVWSILGQTYRPLQVTKSSFAWHATLPPGTFVPPHAHPAQEEFIYLLAGRFDLVLDGQKATAAPGDPIRLPRAILHGLFNNSSADVTCVFWVSPTRRLWDLFQAINNLADPPEVLRLAGLHEVNFVPPP
jgi:quercetin dioxygenase-like cupin family protein